ncbi:hypothetical protein [Gabonibacter chumensis]|uniref:hypothetical protein n=1 Tax=Gabonibacter chumensis TaxID=2972474 RepID=UPI002572D5A2|nr:hypothetical protein [Gabonibacter chumensis]MCR9011376.1 hypothetical protein [Gabonibacter chumensis]
MKKWNITGAVFMLFAVLGITGCNDKDDPFTGMDNYITSFILTQGSSSLKAELINDSIIITAPAALSLEGAKAELTLSERARITPSPEEIDKWDEQMLFKVNAANGEQRVYYYLVKKEQSVLEGSVQLTTQEEVNAFETNGITAINGNLIIASTSGEDSITSLVPLHNLREIRYDLIVNDRYTGKDLLGLENLERVGGVSIQAGKNLELIEFPNLISVGKDFTVNHAKVEQIVCPKLNRIGRHLNVSGNLAQTEFPALEEIEGGLTYTSSGSLSLIPTIYFPNLVRIGANFSIEKLEKVERIDLPALERCGGMSIFANTSKATLKILNTPALQEVSGTLDIRYCQILELEMPVLEQVAEIKLRNNSILACKFPLLREITGNLTLESLSHLENLDGFPALASIGGIFTIQSITHFEKFEAPATLKKINELKLSNLNNITEIHIKGLDIATLNLLNKTLATAKVIGDKVFNGILRLECTSSISQTDNLFPLLEGIEEIGGLDLNGYALYNIDAQGITKINGDLTANTSSLKTLKFPHLTEVSGNFTLKSSLSSLTEFGVPLLAKVGANLKINNFSKNFALEIPALTAVGGDMTISTADYSNSFASIEMPALTSIGNKLTLNTSSSYYTNKALTHLDGFSALASVKEVEITSQAALVSFLGLKQAIPGISSLKTEKNKYNPTLEMLQNGQWTAPNQN